MAYSDTTSELVSAVHLLTSKADGDVRLSAKSTMSFDAGCRTRIYRCRTVPKQRCCFPLRLQSVEWGAHGRENEKARKLNGTSSDPPLGPPVPNWLPRQLPPLAVMNGRTCRVENRQHPAWQGVVRRLRYGSRGPPLDIPAMGTIFRARRIVRPHRCRPGQRRAPGIRTDRRRERQALRPSELSEY